MASADRLTSLIRALDNQQEDLRRLHRYAEGQSAIPHIPVQASPELKKLATIARTAWGGLIIEAVAERLAVDGIKASDPRLDDAAWGWWQANGLDAGQAPVHTDALLCAETHVLVWPGRDGAAPTIRGLDRRDSIGTRAGTSIYTLTEAAYRWDAGPVMLATLYDAGAAHMFARLTRSTVPGSVVRWWREEPDEITVDPSDEWQLIDVIGHDMGVCPVVRVPNTPDLRGDGASDLAAHIPAIDRITETVMGRLTAGKFGAFRQQWASGIELGTQIDAQTGQPVLGADGLPVTAGAPFRYGTDLVWTSENPDTRFGSFEATDLRPIIEAVEQDIKHLAAVTRTPAHYLLGSSANPPSAEALLAAESGLVAKVGRRQLGFGEAWEQVIRVAAIAAGERDLAEDQALQVTWRNTQVRSPGAVADALLKLRQAGIPLEVLLEWIGFSPLAVTRTMELSRAEAAAQASAQAAAYGVGG
ncbi:MAG: phage portal protein [Candidatus Nanopelagicales bacterium]